MIAKVIAHGETRIAAIERLDAALADFHVLGISTNIGFIRDLLADSEFRDGNLDTGFLSRFSSRRPERTLPSIVQGLLGQRLPSAIHSANTGGSSGSGKPASTGRSGPWDAQDRWRNVEV
jgi:acetyl/propionyl-CoA carboxylase alpha subunit